MTVNHRAHFFTLIKTVCADLKLSEFTVIQHRSYVVLHNLYIELCIWCLAKEKSGLFVLRQDCGVFGVDPGSALTSHVAVMP